MDKSVQKLSLYLETSVWNFVFADDAPEKRDATKLLFKEIREGKFEIYISDLVAGEIGNTKGPKRDHLEKLIQGYAPIQLLEDDKVKELSNAYTKAKFAPEKAAADLTHVAYTVAHKLDVIVSWNLKHIVRLKTKLAVNGINKLLGYREIEIVTPEEALSYGSL